MFFSNGQNWTAICDLDADNDGKTNGVELGDPECVWERGTIPAGPATGHPGLSVCLSVRLSVCLSVCLSVWYNHVVHVWNVRFLCYLKSVMFIFISTGICEIETPECQSKASDICPTTTTPWSISSKHSFLHYHKTHQYVVWLITFVMTNNVAYTVIIIVIYYNKSITCKSITVVIFTITLF